MAGIAFLIVGFARALGAILLAAHQGQLGQHGRVADEHRDVIRKLPYGNPGDPLVPCRAPAKRVPGKTRDTPPTCFRLPDSPTKCYSSRQTLVALSLH